MAQSTQQPGSSKSASSPTQKLKASPKPHPISSPASSSRPMSNHASVERPALSKEKKGEHKRRKRKSKAARAVQLKELESDQATPVPTNEEWPSIPLTEADSVHPAVFSRDSRFIFVPSSSSVKVYSTDTLNLVSTLSPLKSRSASRSASSSHTDTVTALCLNPSNPFQLYTASRDGTIKIWDWIEGVMLKNIRFGRPIVHMRAHESHRDALFIAYQRQKTRSVEARKSYVTRISLTEGNPREEYGTIESLKDFRVSTSGSYIVAVAARLVHIAFIADPARGFCELSSPNTADLTCLEFNPVTDVFATGDADGQIHVWHSLINHGELSWEQKKNPKVGTASTLHWHAHAVRTISFTPNAAYLLSGGAESTLVLWSSETKKPSFVPRVGAPIESLGVTDHPERGQEVLLGLRDGSMAMFSVTRGTFRRRTEAVKLNSISTEDNRPNLLAICPSTHTLILSSYHPASLQLYNPHTSAASELEVAPSNRVSGPNSESLLTPSYVNHAAFSQDGSWLVTVDEKEATMDSLPAGFLKFWKLDPKSNKWQLDCRVDRPHGTQGVERIVFAPSSPPRLATAGLDSAVKAWGTFKNKVEKGKETWVSRATIKYRDLPPSDLCYSTDENSSVLVVAHGPIVTVWDSKTHNIVRALSMLPFLKIESVRFVGEAGRYLAVCGTGSRDSLVLWDLVSDQTVYRLPRSEVVPLVVPHPHSHHFAVISPTPSTTTIRIFDPASPTSLRERELPFSASRAVLMTSASSTFAFTLAILAKDGTTYLTGDDASLPEREGAVARSLSKQESARVSLFEDVFGRSAFKDLEAEKAEETMSVDNSFGAKIDWKLLDGPAHLLPPLETMFASLMGGVLLKPTEEAPAEEHEDVEMEVVEQPSQPEFQTKIHQRFVSQDEVNMLVELFSKHAVVGPSKPSTTSDTAKPNGKANGHHPSSASLAKKRSQAKLNAASVHLPSPSPTPTPSQIVSTSLPSVGQKRKHRDVELDETAAE